jgi:hypothetical protein
VDGLMVKYTHAVVHSILVEKNGRPFVTDELVYAINIEHAHALAHQGLAVGWSNVAILELETPTTIEDTPNE